MRILLVEDERKVALFIKRGLEEEYYTVDVSDNGNEGCILSLSEDYDLIILDIMLPYKDGITILKEIRSEKLSVPVLLLTAKDTISDKVQGLDLGADDYLAKPFAFEELLARVRALLRRSSVEKSIILKAGELSLNTQTHKVTINGKELQLTPKEYSILEYLLRNKNRVISKIMLSQHVYDYQFDSETNVIEVFINKLRKKINSENNNSIIKTIRGVGYVLKDQ